jgi:hypothetical protein
MLRSCPSDGLDELVMLHAFNIVLNYICRILLDYRVGCAFVTKRTSETKIILDNIHVQWHNERAFSSPKRT